MNSAAEISALSNSDRLGLTVFGSALVHLVIVLGVTFTLPRIAPKPDPLPNLEIVLVQSRSDEQPEKADFLAQASQEGGGESEASQRPRSPLPAQEAISAVPVAPAASPPQPRAEPAPPPEPEHLTRETPQAAAKPKAVEPRPEPRPRERAPRAGMLDLSLTDQRAQLSAEISESWEQYQKRPRRTFISARTRAYKYAAYMDAWRAKVERIGNLNYPEEAKRRGLTGDLIMDVALNPDGSIDSITIKRSSGHAVLDDAAKRIVTLSAPFAPFPDDIRADTDILHINRTWQFVHGSTWRSK
jgi:protein TonB